MIALDSPVTLLHGAVEDALKFVPDNSVDAVVTDPPYALDMGGGTSHWDRYGPRAFARWCEIWARECLRAAKPGAWLLAASSARTYHRLVCGVEDAGWQIIDCIDWVYPLSFHRAVDLPTRLAKAGASEEVISSVEGRSTSLKSRREPFVLARAPLASGGLIQTVIEHGTATLDVESTAAPDGSWPCNLVLSHSELCVEGGQCFPGCPKLEMGANAHLFPAFYWCDKPSSVERPKVEVEIGKGTGKLSTIGEVRRWRCRVCEQLTHSYLKKGSTYSSVPQKVCEHYDQDPTNYVPLRVNDYVSEVSHNTVKPLKLMRWMVRMTTKPGDTVLEPFAGSGTTVEASVAERRRVIAVERDLPSIELTRSRLRRSHCIAGQRATLQEADPEESATG